MTKRLLSILAIMIFIVFSACAYNAEIAEDAYKALEASAIMYDQSMTVSAALYEKGLISVFDKDQIIKGLELFYAAHNASVDILAVYGKYTNEDIEKLRIKLPECYFEEIK